MVRHRIEFVGGPLDGRQDDVPDMQMAVRIRQGHTYAVNLDEDIKWFSDLSCLIRMHYVGIRTEDEYFQLLKERHQKEAQLEAEYQAEEELRAKEAQANDDDV